MWPNREENGANYQRLARILGNFYGSITNGSAERDPVKHDSLLGVWHYKRHRIGKGHIMRNKIFKFAMLAAVVGLAACEGGIY